MKNAETRFLGLFVVKQLKCERKHLSKMIFKTKSLQLAVNYGSRKGLLWKHLPVAAEMAKISQKREQLNIRTKACMHNCPTQTYTSHSTYLILK